MKKQRAVMGSKRNSSPGSRRIRDRIYWVSWIALIFILSSIPGNDLPEVPGFQPDKLVHFSLYFLLAILTLRAFGTQQNRNRIPWIALIFCVGYGVTDELHQLFVPGRSPSPWDLLADGIGAAIGSVLWRVLARRRNPVLH